MNIGFVDAIWSAFVTYIQSRKQRKADLVLAALVGAERSAADIAQHIRLVHGISMGSGTLYPILLMLERDDAISSRWAWPNKIPGRSRRRMYKLKEPPS
jgi:DNA-binding PadR family transcriptional regulator